MIIVNVPVMRPLGITWRDILRIYDIGYAPWFRAKAAYFLLEYHVMERLQRFKQGGIIRVSADRIPVSAQAVVVLGKILMYTS